MAAIILVEFLKIHNLTSIVEDSDYN